MTNEITQALVEPFVSAAHGDFETVKRMLAEHPALLNARWEKFDETALQAATQTGNRAIVDFLLAQGAPMEITTAAMLGDADKVAEFLKQDPALANAKGSHGFPIMYHAAMSGSTRIADLLLARGGGQGMDFALHGAVKFGQAEFVTWLLAHGVKDVNFRNFEGKTPLTVALEKGYYEIADMLQSEGGSEAG